jgi:cell division protein FtsW
MVPDRIAHEPTPPPPTLRDQIPVIAPGECEIDVVLVAAVLGLVVLGTIEVFSASAVYGMNTSGDSMFFLKRQIAWFGMGLTAMATGATTSYRWLHRFAYPLLLLALLLLGGVLVFGTTINSARRWLIWGPLSFQPVELAKLALVAYLAHSLARKSDRIRTFTVGFVPHLIVCAVMMLLLLLQPDLGSALILGAATLTLLFVAGAKVSYLLLAVLAAAPVVYQLIVGTPWRLKRFMAYFNPEAYAEGVGYQIVQSLIAVGSGGATGVGLGEGRQQLGYMPEMHNDFILSSVGEELGFVGICLVLGLFLVILWRGVRAALHARDTFGAYLAFGLTAMLALQALINAGVVLGALPAKGLTLPFVSYGGSSLISSMFVAGVLLSVARRAPPSTRPRAVVNRLGAMRRKRRAVIVRGCPEPE